MAGLLQYFRHEPKQKLPVWPYQKGEKVSSSFEFRNNIVHDILDKKTTPHGKCGDYLTVTSTQKFLIGNRAVENGVTPMLQY